MKTTGTQVTPSTTATRVVGWLTLHIEPLGATLLGLGLVGAVLLSVMPVRSMVEQYATTWLSELRPPETSETEIPVIPSLKTPVPENLRLLRQLDVIRRRLKFHADVVTFFYARYYLALTIASVTGLLAGAMLVLITRIGWQHANAYVKVTFLVAAGVAAYYAAFPGMFQQARNITENASLYVAYGNVENELLSYLATGENVSGQAQTAQAFVHALDRRLAELHKVAIGFDATKLPSSIEAFKGVDR